MLSIPFLAFRLFTGLGQGFASLSSSLGSALSSASAADSAAVASGNLSAGNVQVDNVNGFKTNLNRDLREGMSTLQLANGASRTFTPEGQTVFNSSEATSRIGVELNMDRNLASAAQRSVRDSQAQTESAMQGYNHSVQETGSQLKQFHEQFGNSDSKTVSASTGLTVTEADRVNRMQQVAEDYANRNHIGLNQAYSELQDKSRNMQLSEGIRGQAGIDSSKSLWGKAGQWVTGASAKGDFHAGIEGTHRTGSTSQVSDDSRSGQDNSHSLSAREATDFSQGIDTLRSYNASYNGQHVDNNASGLMNQISSGITTSDSKYEQYTASQSHTHELQKMASQTETLSAGARDNYTQQFVQWTLQRSPENAETILSNTSDEGIQKQRDTLVQEFFAEKLQGRIDGNYEQNAGRTGEGMLSPVNNAGLQSGRAYENANRDIEAGVNRSSIEKDVKKEVDEIPLVVKNKADNARYEMDQGARSSREGFDNRKGDLENASAKFDEGKRLADASQDNKLPKSLSDYMNKNKK